MNKPIECIIAIVERGKDENLIKTFHNFGCLPHLHFIANGTASNEILDMLGIGTTKRNVIISIGEENIVHCLMNEIRNRDSIHLHTKGLVFTIKATGISSILAKSVYQNTLTTENMEEHMKNKSSLILVSFNQGYSDDIMSIAKSHGAKGGTVFKANWADAEHIEEKYNVPIHREKEILAIVADNNIRKDIMNAIHQEYGRDSKVQALLLSLPVLDKVSL